MKLAAVAFLLIGLFIRLSDLSIKVLRSEDESIYRQQCLELVRDGLMPGGRYLVARYQNQPRLRLYPTPTRLGFVIPAALTMWAAKRHDYMPGVFLSTLASIGSLILTALLAKHVMGDQVALAATAFLATFPPELFVAARNWTDGLTGFLGLATVYLTLRVTASWSNLWAALLMVSGEAGLLTKEISVFVYAPAVLAVLWVNLRSGHVRRALIFASASAVSAVLGWTFLCTVLGGGYLTPVHLLMQPLASIPENPYVLQFQSGPWMVLFLSLLSMSPSVVILGIIGLATAIWMPSGLVSPKLTRWLAVGVLAFLVLYSVTPHWQNIRFLTPAFGPLCAFAAFAALRLSNWVGTRLPHTAKAIPWLTAAAVALIMVSDYSRYRHYCDLGMTDLSAGMVLAAGRR